MQKAVITLVIALLISACEGANEPPLRVGTNTWIGYEPFYMARKMGHYKDSGIKLVEMTSASNVINALRAGSLEAAALTLDEVLLLLSEGFKLQIVLIIDYSNGADVLLGKPVYNSISDLRGHRVVVENSAVGAILLDGALNAAGMSPADITLISCLASQHVTCFEDADAVVTFEPIKSELIAQGAKVLFDSSEIPNRIIDVLVVRNDAAGTNPKAIKKLLDGYFLAIQPLADKLDKNIKLKPGRFKATAEKLAGDSIGIRFPTLSENRTLLSGAPTPISVQAEQLIEFMLQRKLLPDSTEIKFEATNRYLPESLE